MSEDKKDKRFIYKIILNQEQIEKIESIYSEFKTDSATEWQLARYKIPETDVLIVIWKTCKTVVHATPDQIYEISLKTNINFFKAGYECEKETLNKFLDDIENYFSMGILEKTYNIDDPKKLKYQELVDLQIRLSKDLIKLKKCQEFLNNTLISVANFHPTIKKIDDEIYINKVSKLKDASELNWDILFLNAQKDNLNFNLILRREILPQDFKIFSYVKDYFENKSFRMIATLNNASHWYTIKEIEINNTKWNLSNQLKLNLKS